jgi:quercetin dioxygenase-like cupin family protein
MNKFRMVCSWTLLVALIACAVFAYGQVKSGSEASHRIVGSADLKWSAIIKGCDLAPVSGDPDADGTPFVLRIRCVDGAKIPAHWHPADENVTVLKGTFLAGLGEKFDESKLLKMSVGSFILMPKEMRHFAMSEGETIVQVHGVGPFKVNWVDPADVAPPDGPAAPAKTQS